MLKKAEAIYERYRFLTEKLSDNEVLQDMDVWRKYSKEQAELTEVADKYQEYATVERDMQSAFDNQTVYNAEDNGGKGYTIGALSLFRAQNGWDTTSGAPVWSTFNG